MTAALHLVPPPPRSDVRAASPVDLARLRARADVLLRRAAVEVQDLGAEATARREDSARHHNAWGTLEHMVAARRAAEAQAIEDAAAELAWLAAGCPLPRKVRP